MCPFLCPSKLKKAPTKNFVSACYSGAEGQNFNRLWRSNCRHGDFQTKFLKTQKCCNNNQLILFHFSSNFWFRLEPFGNV